MNGGNIVQIKEQKKQTYTLFYFLGVQAAVKTKTNTLNASETPAGVRRSAINNDGKSDSIEKTNSIAAEAPRWVISSK